MASRATLSFLNEEKNKNRFITQCIDFAEKLSFEKHVCVKLEHCAIDINNIQVHRTGGNRESDDISEIQPEEDIDDDEDDYFTVEEQHVCIFTKCLTAFSCVEEYVTNINMPSIISVFGMVKLEKWNLSFNIYVYEEKMMIKEHLLVCLRHHYLLNC